MFNWNRGFGAWPVILALNPVSGHSKTALEILGGSAMREIEIHETSVTQLPFGACLVRVVLSDDPRVEDAEFHLALTYKRPTPDNRILEEIQRAALIAARSAIDEKLHALGVAIKDAGRDIRDD